MRKPKINKMAVVAVGIVAVGVAAAGKDGSVQAPSRLSANINQVKYQGKILRKLSQNESVLIADCNCSSRGQKGLSGPTLPS